MLRFVRWASRWWPALVAAPASAATLPEDRNELMFHRYEGGGVTADGPALLVRKSLADKVSLFGSYYVDAVSNASIDVVTTASPFKETRKAYELGADWLTRDTLVSLAASTSREPDYTARSASLDVAHEVFGGMSTVSLGFTRGSDEVGKHGEPGWRDQATHWQYRVGLTQVLSPRWLASINAEAVHDAGYLASPYRVARVVGAFVHENVPRTRASRAVKLRSLLDVGDGPSRLALRAEYRWFQDNWDISAHTAELGASRYFGPRWLADVGLRWYRQGAANFYSDNAPLQTLYLSRNRQLSAFNSTALAAKATWSVDGAAAAFDLKLTAALEFKQFRFGEFTDLRSGTAYRHNATLLQLLATAKF